MDWEFGPVASFVDRLVSTGRVPGAGIAFAIDGEPVFQHFVGEGRPGVAASPETIWPLASISKAYTGAAIMKLIEQGVLSLGMKVSAVLPELQGGGKERITLRQLLTHTSGLPYEPENLAALLAAAASVEDLIDEAYCQELLFPPGTARSYSDFGYGLAGRMAATVAGVSFPELIRSTVLEPGDLGQSFLPVPPDEAHRVAEVSGVTGFGCDWSMYNSEYGRGLTHPSFGVSATLSDTLNFALLFDPAGKRKFLSEAGFRTMTTDQSGGDDSGEIIPMPKHVIHDWGIGFMVKGRSGESGLASPESYGHQGATGCVVWIDPRYNASLAFVSNSHYNRNPGEWLDRVEQAINVVLAAVSRGE